MTFLNKWQYFCNLKKSNKTVQKNYKKGMNSENTEKDIQENEVNLENNQDTTEIPTVELSVEEKLQEELINEKDKFLRLFAEFENYKRRTAKERLDLFKTANQEVLQVILSVLDDFDRAMIQISKSQDADLLKGVELIHEKLKSTLVSKGLEEVSVRAGDVFNADFAEAITQIPAPSKD